MREEPKSASMLVGAQRSELDKLGHSLAYEFAVAVVDSESLRVGHRDFGGWRQLEIKENSELYDAVRYLDMRGLIERHPENSNWVQIRQEAEATA
jgi:hypothetical protein